MRVSVGISTSLIVAGISIHIMHCSEQLMLFCYPVLKRRGCSDLGANLGSRYKFRRYQLILSGPSTAK